MNKKFKIAVFISIIILALLVTVISVDYARYKSNQKPIFIFEIIHYDYEDGYVNEYKGLGYKYFEYRRDALNEESFVPLWVSRKE